MNTGTSEQAIEQTSEQERECRRMTYNLVYNEIKFHGLNCIVRVSKPDDRSGVVRFILFLNLRIFELTVCTRLFHWHSTHFKTNRFCFPHSLSCWLQNICITIPPRSRSFWSSAFIVHSFSLFVLLLFDDLCFMIFMHFVHSFVRSDFMFISHSKLRTIQFHMQKRAYTRYTCFWHRAWHRNAMSFANVCVRYSRFLL